MSKHANPAVIGAFVIGAVALLALFVMLFGGAELLRPKHHYVTYFQTSVKGLRVGSNVVSSGVRIGFVSDIRLLTEIDTFETLVEVTMQVNPDAYAFSRGGVKVGDSLLSRDDTTLDDAIAQGLRAQLEIESIVTGQLLVALDFHPDQPGVLLSADPPYPEIPSIPTGFEQFVETVQELARDLRDRFDVTRFLQDLQGTASGVNALVNNADIGESLAGVNRLVNSAEFQGLAARVDTAITDLQALLAEARGLVAGLDRDLQPAVEGLAPAIEELNATLEAARAVLNSAHRQVEGDTEMAYALTGTLSELQRTIRTLRVFIEYIEQNPEAFLRGKAR
jgi:paraquat-inducible protein B